MATRHLLRSLPGLTATLLMVVVATLLAFTMTASFFYEGWGQPLPAVFGYAAPALILVVLGLVALRWPAPGGALLIVAALGSATWWLLAQIRRQMAPLDALLATALMLAGPVVLAGLLFFFEARHRRRLREEGVGPRPRWFGRHWRETLLVALPALAVALMSVQQLPALLARQDDGLRGARVIAGNGVTLVWAPQGPGWNWAPADALATWESLAHHGMPSLERCAYLNENGTALVATPVRVWRMPTVDEIVRSLTRRGENAGCVWDGRSSHAVCRTAPDKETPLWAPDQRPIYYWSSHGPGPATAFAVNYTAGISVLQTRQPHRAVGFRCVKAPRPAL